MSEFQCFQGTHPTISKRCALTLYDQTMLIDLIASDDVIDAAYQWMCEKRAHHHFNSDVWA